MEDGNAEHDLMTCGGLVQEISEKNNFSMLSRDHFYDILVNNVPTFYPYLTSMCEAKVESFGLIPLEEEISKQPSKDSAMGLFMLN